MATIDEQLVIKVVGEVLARLKTQNSAPSSAASQFGVYDDMDSAAEAANRSFIKLREGGITARKKSDRCHPQAQRAKGKRMGGAGVCRDQNRSP